MRIRGLTSKDSSPGGIGDGGALGARGMNGERSGLVSALCKMLEDPPDDGGVLDARDHPELPAVAEVTPEGSESKVFVFALPQGARESTRT